MILSIIKFSSASEHQHVFFKTVKNGSANKYKFTSLSQCNPIVHIITYMYYVRYSKYQVNNCH